MKKVLFIILFVAAFTNVNSQTWCPPGATWYYGYSVWQVAGFYKISYIGDTVINTISCKILSKTKVEYKHAIGMQDTTYLNDEYTYSDANKVYIYRLGGFYTLYDFSAAVGDTITLAGYPIRPGCDSLGTVKVDSVGTVVVNSESLRYISVSPISGSAWGWNNSRIIEKIGPVSSFYYTYLFPMPIDYCGFTLDELGEGGNFRCYSDTNFGFYSNGSVPCDFTVSTDETRTNFKINFYPNPTNTNLNVKITSNEIPEYYQIIDITGKIIITEKIVSNNFTISTENLTPSVYNLYVFSKNKPASNKRFSVIK